MKMLYRKMIRDLSDHKIQFISIFIMAFIGVFAFTGISGEVVGVSEVYTNYYEDTNLADGWIYGENFDTDTLTDVQNMDEIKGAHREMVVETVADYSSDPKITLHVIDGKQEISKFHLFEGSDYNSSDKEGIWLDKRFADAHDLDVGDKFTLKYEGDTISKTIRGLIYSPEYVYYIQDGGMLPDFSKIGFAYISSEGADFDLSYNRITVDAYKELDSKDFGDELAEVSSDLAYTQFVAREDNLGVRKLSEEVAQHRVFSGIFPTLFVLVSLLTLLTTMSRVIISQRTQIGTLKAMGFSNRSIVYHYLSYGFILSFLGSLLGLILGPTTIPYLFYPTMSSMYTLPYWGPAWDFTFFFVAALMVVFSVLVTYLSVKSINDENPADAMRPKVPKIVSSGFIERTSLWKRFSFNERWNYRDAKINKLRAVMSIFGVFACALLIMTALGMYDSMDDVKDWQYGQIYNYQSKILLDENITDSELSTILKDTEGEEMMEQTIELKYKGNKQTATLMVYNESELFTPTDINRNYIEIDRDGLAISDRLLEVLGLEIGDKVRWHYAGDPKWIDSEITQTYSTPFGQGIIMSPEVFENYGGDDYNYTTNVILTKKDVDKNYSGVKSVSTKEDIVSGWEVMTEAMDLMIYFFISFGSVLAVVVLYNLGLMSFTEIQRELATLKVLGFDSKSLRRLLLTQNIWFSSIGFILAIPASYVLMAFMLTSMGADLYFPVNIYPVNLIITFVMTFGLSLLVNLMFSRKIQNVNMVESLKSNE